MAEAAPAPAPQAPAPQRAQSADLRGVPEPVARIEALLAAEREPEPEPQAQQPQQQAPEEAAPEAEPEYEPQPNAQVEGEEPKPETVEMPLDQLEAIELEVTTKGEDGRDVLEKLPVKELKLGYMRQKDYQRKTAEVARQRDEVAEKTRQAIEGERTQLQQTLQQLQALVVETVAPELQGADLNKLATDDPLEYVRRRNRVDQIQATLSRVQQAQKDMQVKQQADAETKQREAVVRARETLQADIPGWNDTLYQQLQKAGEDFGYTANEVAQWMDPRAIKLLHAATKAKQAVPAKPSPDKRIVAVPKAVKPGASQEASQGQQRRAVAMKQLQTSGRIEDAASVIAGMLK